MPALPEPTDSPDDAPAEQGANTPAKKITPQAAVQHLQDAGLITEDDRTPLTIAKRINHAVFANEPIGNIPTLQEKFREKLAAAKGDLTALAEGGVNSDVFQMVDAYLAEREKHFKESYQRFIELPQPLGTKEYSEVKARAKKKEEQYAGERASYVRMPELINDTVKKYPQILTVGKYRRIGDLALDTVVVGDKAKMRDEVDDVMAEIAAVRLLHVAPEVMATPSEILDKQKRFTEDYKTNIIVAAEDTALHTVGLERFNIFEDADSSPELKRIQALSSLLSAHLHALTTHSRNTDGTTNPPLEDLANNLTTIPNLVHEYQMAGVSLAHGFLNDGPGADDVRMKSVDASLVKLTENAHIPLVPTDEANRAAEKIVGESAAFLRNKFAGKPELLTKIDSLVETATSQKKEAAGYVGKIGAPPPNYTAQRDAEKGPGTGPSLLG
jgi:hypothetical protein